MSTEAILQTPDGRRLVTELSQRLAVDPAQGEHLLARLLQPVVAGIARNTASRGGIAALMRALGSGHHAAALDDPASLATPERIADGTAILGHILGSPAKADATMVRIAQEERLPASAARQLMPMLAVFLMGWLYRNGGSAFGSVLGDAIGAPAPAFGSGGPLSMPRMPGSGGAGTGPVSGDGGSGGGGGFQLPGGLGDILSGGQEADGGDGGFRRGGTMRGPSTNGGGPLSMPDLDRIRQNRSGRAPSDNPYGDLGDIVAGGGGSAGNPAGTIRDILGGLLGFKTSGWIGWIIKMVVLRYGWQILGFVVRRLFLRV